MNDQYTCWCGDDIEDHREGLDCDEERPCRVCDCEDFQPRSQQRLPGVDWDVYERPRRTR